MRIIQIKSSAVCGPKYVGKWYCSDFILGADGDPVTRYLQNDGTWNVVTRYFDSKEEIERLLQLGHKPDFTVSRQEQEERNLIREMAENWPDSDPWDDIY